MNVFLVFLLLTWSMYLFTGMADLSHLLMCGAIKNDLFGVVHRPASSTNKILQFITIFTKKRN